MIKIAICDDEKIITSQIDNNIHDICMRESIPFDTDVFFSGEGLEKEIVSGTKYDLIYLDIQMENGDGITVAKAIRKIDENVLIIYVSGYDRYMMELFRLDVFAFIKKPIEQQNFEKIFLDANYKICNRKFYFSFRFRNEEYKIACIDILYFESSGRKIYVHSKNGDSSVFNGKLSDVEERLKDGKIPFLRIHQSYLVNYHFIRSRSRKLVTLINGMTLPISEDRQRIIGNQYSRILGDEIHA